MQTILERIMINRMEVLGEVQRSAGRSIDLIVEPYDSSAEENYLRDGLCVVRFGDERPGPFPNLHDGFIQPVSMLLVILERQETVKDSGEQRLIAAAKDIHAVWMGDYHADGLVNLNRFVGRDAFDLKHSSARACVITYELEYRTLMDNPYEQ